MPTFPVTYASAVVYCPKAVDEVVAKLRAGRSRQRMAAPDALIWTYQVSTEIRAYSFGEIMNGTAHHEQAAELANRTDDPVKRAEDVLARSHVMLHGKVGRWWGQSEVSGIPPEVRAACVESERLNIEDEKKWHKPLTQAEWERLGRGGLVALSIPVPKKGTS